MQTHIQSGMLSSMTHKHCPGCKASKPIAEFAVSRARPDGRQGYCRSCMSKRWREYAQKNRRASRNMSPTSDISKARAAKLIDGAKDNREYGVADLLRAALADVEAGKSKANRCVVILIDGEMDSDPNWTLERWFCNLSDTEYLYVLEVSKASLMRKLYPDAD